MTDMISDELVKDVKIEKKKNKIVSIGLDCGTMNIVCARSDSNDVKLTRNVFLPLDQDEISVNELSNISYVKGDDGKLFVIGEDAFKMANIFGHQISRPMKKGLISSDEISAMDVLTLIIKDLIGDTKDKEVYCSYSIPAEAIDENRSITYHTRVFGKILNSLGVNHTPINEAAAIIYSECKNEGFSGVGLSFGAGMVNCCVMYKGVEVLKFSTARSGDWIDENVAQNLGIVQNRVTSTKEKELNLTEGPIGVKDKKKARVVEALCYYYESLIDYTVKKLIKEFSDKVDIEVDEKLPIVVSGGTSMPTGFIEMLRDNLTKNNLPFEIKEIRRAKNPMTAVANGLLIKTLADIQNK